ncbi:uncharacterized protein LOC127256531 [Andrographis paniculata]|uniref:uncharacterized protein LOC127256531 n=1 Tax=Andrographis paniculata TaxID=175694 RepID=UPI0021E90866|nr:uncharacterized protein LOC127256531 [Andrographis paniculata]
MRKISGEVLSSKPVSLSRAAKLISRFAAVDNGSTPAIFLYLERTSEAFNHLVQFHKKPSQNSDAADRERVQKLQSDWLERNLEGGKGNSQGDNGMSVDETNPSVDEAQNLSNGGDERKKKKEKKRKGDGGEEVEKKKKMKKSDLVDSEEKKNGKRRKNKGSDS